MYNDKKSREKYERVNIERNVIARCKHPFVIMLEYAFQTPKHLILVLEWMPGTVNDLKKSYPHNSIPEDQVKFICAEVGLALRHLHGMNYVYRDLKPENVLMCSKGHYRLADMGLVARIDDHEHVKPDKKVVKSTKEDGD